MNKLLFIIDFFKYEFPISKQGRIFKKEYIKMINNTCKMAYKKMASHTLSYSSVRGYVVHLPIKGKDGYYPIKAFELSNKCLHSLWKYSINMGFIEESCSFKNFLQKGRYPVTPIETD